MNVFLDRLGISASILCIVHCLATPVLVIFMPLLGGTFAHGWFHLVIAALIIPVAVLALWRGYRLHHRIQVLYLGGLGLILICLALGLDPSYEIPLMVAAGVLLASAHYLNLKICQANH